VTLDSRQARPKARPATAWPAEARCAKWALLMLVLLVPIRAAAQDAAADRIDTYLRDEMARQQIPGLAVAVVRDGTIALAKGYGLANVEHQVPVKPETVFQSGSVGKQFTATAVMLLVEQGRVSLDDRVTKYLPEGAPRWNAIRVRHLLTHTGGTTDYPSNFDFRRDYTEAALVKRAAAIPLAFAPGTRWSYSNIGYLLLGVLIHRVTGEFYGDFLKERIFEPLGMTTTRIISEADIVPNRAGGYRLVKGEVKNQEWVSPTLNTTADGSLYLSVLDLAKWDASLYTERILRSDSLKRMWTPVSLNSGKTRPYGFGWALGEIHGHRVVEHGGAWQGFKSAIVRFPDDRLTVVLLANLAQTDLSKLAHGIAAIVDPTLAPVEENKTGKQGL
jgi:CubicO group peptidase (beta-lactamase class C family)